MNTGKMVVLILTFICFLVWFGVGLIRTKPSVVVGPELEQALEPIDPNFDQDTLSKIQAISRNSPLPTLKPSASSRPTPSPSPTKSPSPSPNISTSSAQLSQ